MSYFFLLHSFTYAEIRRSQKNLTRINFIHIDVDDYDEEHVAEVFLETYAELLTENYIGGKNVTHTPLSDQLKSLTNQKSNIKNPPSGSLGRGGLHSMCF